MATSHAPSDLWAAPLAAVARIAFVMAAWLTGCVSPYGAGAEVVTEPATPLLAEEARAAARAAAAGSAGTPAGTPADDTADDTAAASPVTPSDRALIEDAGVMLDAWHAAASVGDQDRYLGSFTPDAVFLGTDETERWDLATFSAYVKQHFRGGAGWTYTPFNRHVLLGPAGQLAWFDEQLDSAGYGALRGTGVLARVEDRWKIVHYSMTFTVPNGAAREVVEIVRQAR